jgi:ComF family protein
VFLLNEWTLTLKNLFLPTYCKLCGVWLLTEENGFFCPDCWEMSPGVEAPFCSRCGKPHATMVGYGVRADFPCEVCREKPNRYVRRIYGAAQYEGAVEIAVKLMKFHDRERLAGPLGELMRDFAEEYMACEDYDVVVPVPLHRVRARARGYNQSYLLAEAAMDAFPKAVLDQSLKRIRPTRTQSKLTGKARKANVQGAFAVLGDSLEGRTVLLVDDVVTSAGTVTECARVLRRAGAAEVDVFAVALATWVGAKKPKFW